MDGISVTSVERVGPLLRGESGQSVVGLMYRAEWKRYAVSFVWTEAFLTVGFDQPIYAGYEYRIFPAILSQNDQSDLLTFLNEVLAMTDETAATFYVINQHWSRKMGIEKKDR